MNIDVYNVFVELLNDLGRRDLINKLPKCICEAEEIKAVEHQKYSDVGYHWECPIHGKQIAKRLMEMLLGG